MASIHANLSKRELLAIWIAEFSRESARPGPASFYDFPGEIRNQIYDYHLSQVNTEPPHFWHNKEDSDNEWKAVLDLANACKKVREEVLPLFAHRVKRLTTSIDGLVNFVNNYEDHGSQLLNTLAGTGSILTVECNRTWTRDLNLLPTSMALRKLPDLQVVLIWSCNDSKDSSGLSAIFEMARNSEAWSPTNPAKLGVTGVMLQKEEQWCCPKQHVSRGHVWDIKRPVITTKTTARSGDWSQEHSDQARQVLESLGIEENSGEDSFNVFVNTQYSEVHFERLDWFGCPLALGKRRPA